MIGSSHMQCEVQCTEFKIKCTAVVKSDVKLKICHQLYWYLYNFK